MSASDPNQSGAGSEHHLAAMRQADLFHGLSEEELKRVASLCIPEDYADGKAIINEDDKGTEIFVLTKGRVDVEISWPLGSGTQRIDTLGPGHIFGELTLIDGFLRSATVRARGDVEVLVIHDGKLVDLMDQDHTVGYKVMKNVAHVLAARIRETNLRLRNAITDVLY